MTTPLPTSGRPRDLRIDAAVLEATVTLLSTHGYAGLSVAAVAERAGTTKPAIYRRWPSKAQLVHEAAFPDGADMALPDTGSVGDDVREMVRRTTAVFATPAGRAALPGLVAEFAADPALHAQLLGRFGATLGAGLADRLAAATSRGDVRADVTAVELIEAIVGPVLMGLLTRPDSLDDTWVERTAALITRGIAP